VGIAVAKLKLGVAVASTGAGDEIVSGVEAWSVANRSGVGVEAAGMLHPAVMERIIKIVGKSLNLFKVHLNGFNMEFLTGQNFGAEASAIGA
jgi:isoaspartyl peptidase/L-asparaginase-like protein (Ntn-hydrolase superfamily)